MPEFKPTAEQQNAVDLFATGQGLAIEAGAGTGKTSTLELLATASSGKVGRYIAFNKSVATEAGRKFPDHVQCSTAHSLAFRSVGKQYAHRLNSGRMTSPQIASRLGIGPLAVPVDGGKSKTLAAGFLAGRVMQAVEQFCQSADMEITERHFPYIDGIDVPTDAGRRTYDNNNEVRRVLVPAARKAWADLFDPEGQLPYKHSHYLKAWHLSGPEIPCDFLLFDEAQDANPVLLDIVEKQAAHGVQLVFVGDSQQQIYCQPVGTKVRVPTKVGGGRGKGGPRYEWDEVPIEDVVAGDKLVSYSMPSARLRKSGNVVTRVEHRMYDGPMIVAKIDGHTTRYTPDHHVVARLGEPLTDGPFVVYMMRRGDQYRIGKTTWRYESQNLLVGPVARARAERADGLWILSAHQTETEALLAEAVTAHRFGIPTWTFTPARGSMLVVDFWAAVGENIEHGEACLRSFGRLPSEPLWTPSDHAAWAKRPSVIAAANLMDGMTLLPADDLVRDDHHRGDHGWRQSWQPTTITREHYTGTIVSLSVDVDHTYIADGIVTHNSFTGAVNALAKVPAELRAYLTQSFRFGPAIAEQANLMLERLDADLRITGTDRIASTVGEISDPDAILCRTNGKAVETVMDQQREGRKVHMVGDGREVVRFAEAADQLARTGHTGHPELACFESWREVQEYVENDPAGSELKLLVGLVDNHGTSQIKAAFDRMCPERSAQIVVSTAHKAKGREWSSVQLAADFYNPRIEPGEESEDELRLLYVAATRAQHRLDVSRVPAFTGKRPEAEGPAEESVQEWFDTATGQPIPTPEGAK